MNIQPIVEGHGDVAAVPVLLRRLLNDAGVYHVGVNRPIRRQRSHFATQTDVEKAVRLAILQPDCGSILVLFDADDACPRDDAPEVEQWAAGASGTVPCRVVMATREYEAWFLAAVESLRGQRGILGDAVSHPNPEDPRDAKGALEERMARGRSYVETADQPALTARFDMGSAHRRCRSFRRMTDALDLLTAAMGAPRANPWPWDEPSN